MNEDLLLVPFSLFSKGNADELQCSGREDCEVTTWIPKVWHASSFICTNCFPKGEVDDPNA